MILPDVETSKSFSFHFVSLRNEWYIFPYSCNYPRLIGRSFLKFLGERIIIPDEYSIWSDFVFRLFLCSLRNVILKSISLLMNPWFHKFFTLQIFIMSGSYLIATLRYVWVIKFFAFFNCSRVYILQISRSLNI